MFLLLLLQLITFSFKRTLSTIKRMWVLPGTSIKGIVERISELGVGRYIDYFG